MPNAELIEQLAHYAFQGLGFQMTPESLDRSFLGIAWSIGMPKPEAGWASVPAIYHYEEAVALLFLAMEAELTAGYITTLIKSTEGESGRTTALDLAPSAVLGGMMKWSYAHAAHRASVAGSPEKLSISETSATFDMRSTQYRVLVQASVQNSIPMPIPDFQLGLQRSHPWAGFVCYISDCVCEALNLENDGLEAKIVQLAISQKRTAFYRGLLGAHG